MLIRIKFSKLGSVKFIGHLDLMRYFQKALSRTGLPVKYSNGFHPHQIMTFASPLGVGLTSDGEYMDFELISNEEASKYTGKELLSILNNSLTEGIHISEVTILDPREPNKKKESVMALVNSADYLLYFKDNCSTEHKKDIFQLLQQYLGKKELIIFKKTKLSEAELDIKPYIYQYSSDFHTFIKNHNTPEEYRDKTFCSISDKPEDECLYLHLSAGSAMNLKPELIIESCLSHYERLLSKNELLIHRIELYHDTEKGSIPLWAIK